MIKFAIIGTGSIAHEHAKAIKEIKDAELVAVLSSSEERAKKFSEEYKIKAFINYDELLNEEVDAIDIACMNYLHADYGIKAALHGKHVLVEKPLDVSLEKAKKLIDVCEKQKVMLSTISQHRYDGAIIHLKRLIAKGKLGEIINVRVSIGKHRSKQYYLNSNQWRASPNKCGGGIFLMYGIHYIDVMSWLFGDVESVVAKMSNVKHKIEVEDTAEALYKFKNGTNFRIEVTSALTKNRPDMIEVHGTKGSYIIRYFKFGSITNKIPFLFKVGKIKNQVEEFTKAIKAVEESYIVEEDGLTALRLVLAAYDSHNKNKIIKC